MIFQQIFLQKKSFVCLSQHFVALNFWAYAKVFSKPVLNTTKVIFTQQSFIFISLTQNILSNRKSMNLLISLFFLAMSPRICYHFPFIFFCPSSLFLFLSFTNLNAFKKKLYANYICLHTNSISAMRKRLSGDAKNRTPIHMLNHLRYTFYFK